MKKNDWIFLISLGAYTYLFWEQEPGLNFLIMNCILLGGIILRDKTVVQDKVWLFTATASLVTAACVAWYGNVLSVFANFVSLLVTSVFTLHKRNSFFVAMMLGAANTAAAGVFMLIAFVERLNRTDGNSSPSRTRLKKIVLVLAVAIIGFVFFLLYRESSLLFQSFTDKIDLSFISFEWCAFVAFGTVMLFAFYRQQRFARLSDWDRNLPMNLQPKERNSFFDKLMSVDSEYFSGLVLLGMLNALLLVVNALDITFLIGGAGMLPDDVTYSEYVHQGISTLILSIMFAGLIILFWFRNYHTAGKSYRHLRLLALLWVVQNMFMLAFSVYRNHSYIFVYGLTYKRIGVDVWLLLALAGLALVMWKLYRQKSNAYVLKYFGWTCFTVLVLSAPVNWDKVIFGYNAGLQHRLDMMYANSLSYNSLAEQHKYKVDNYELSRTEHTDLHAKTFQFLSRHRYLRDSGEWPSWNLATTGVYEELLGMELLPEDSALTVSHCQLNALYYFPCYSKITELDVSWNYLVTIGEASQYRNLEKLTLYNNTTLNSISGIQHCTHLEELDLRGTGVTSFGPIMLMPQLHVLKVSSMPDLWSERLRLTNPDLTILIN